ncbi:MAG: CAP domain-containing protein [bacterium]
MKEKIFRKIVKDFFVPYDGNGHKPKALRPMSLVLFVIFLAFLKFGLVGYLFFAHPQEARTSDDIAKQIIELTNKDRENVGASFLIENENLKKAAMAKAEDMAQNNYFDHFGPDGKKPWDWIDKENYDFQFVGENLAMNFYTAEGAHMALMNSPTHQKNILNKNYVNVGIAVLSGELNGKKTNILVEMFGKEKNAQLATALVDNQEDGQNISENFEQESKAVTLGIENNDENIINNKVVAVPPSPNVSAEDSRIVGASRRAGIINDIFIVSLVFVILLLLINIFVRVEIQHRPVIVQTLMVILFIASLAALKVHYLESVLPNILLM